MCFSSFLHKTGFSKELQHHLGFCKKYRLILTFIQQFFIILFSEDINKCALIPGGGDTMTDQSNNSTKVHLAEATKTLGL